jgi:hypothetical protein
MSRLARVNLGHKRLILRVALIHSVSYQALGRRRNKHLGERLLHQCDFSRLSTREAQGNSNTRAVRHNRNLASVLSAWLANGKPASWRESRFPRQSKGEIETALRRANLGQDQDTCSRVEAPIDVPLEAAVTGLIVRISVGQIVARRPVPAIPRMSLST